MPLSPFHPVVAAWFRERFPAPTTAQALGWPAIARGEDTLIAAPTGSGKTLTAFLWCLDGLLRKGISGQLSDQIEVLYVSPLKALSNDVEKNLVGPLAELQRKAWEMGHMLPEIRVAVRTGDTPQAERLRMVKTPPHVLITTPESLYILLTADKSRRALATVRTVIVDEIHAVVGDKRGAHLALSLERLTTNARTRPVRIGLSATQSPIAEVAQFLVGSGRAIDLPDGSRRPDCTIVDTVAPRDLDLAVETPRDELSAVASHEQWGDLYDRLADLVRAHRATLVFANTRRLVERATHALGERLGEEQVAAHHGSLSRKIRHRAEQRLKDNQVKVVVATGSLELGIDIGAVDLVVQLGSPRSLSVLVQRVGRSGHQVGGRPKGRLFATTRDELLECAALVRAARRGGLDRTRVRRHPLDVLAQQITAECAARVDGCGEEELFAEIQRAWPYATLPRAEYDDVIAMLSDGVATQRGRSGAWLHRDRVNGQLKARRGARLAAITSGGAIPDVADYAVVAEPEGLRVGTVDEDFAIESMRGDIFLLGNTSWRIRRVEAGTVRVEDAAGAPPTIPFWNGEAPGRSDAASAAVSELREEIAALLADEAGGRATARALLQAECGLDEYGAAQTVAYLAAVRGSLGVVPSQNTLCAERFFDDAGGMQLLLHAPFGARINRAWGLALRKRFCRSFNFELQAAATDDGIVISLGPQHSFPLLDVFRFVDAEHLREVLIQALLAAPMFPTRWRWNATRSLTLLRFSGGRRTPPPLLRMKADDLMAAVFPQAAACQENVVGDIQLPDHPLVNETIRDCLSEPMDVEGAERLVGRIERGEIALVAKDVTEPSPLAHALLNANPYAFLDDAPLEERRTRAVSLRRTLPDDARDLGALDEAAIAEVVADAWPDVRDADELHDALLTLSVLPERDLDQHPDYGRHLGALLAARRATRLVHPAGAAWVAAERIPLALAAFPDARLEPPIATPPGIAVVETDPARLTLVRARLEVAGPLTAAELATALALPIADVEMALPQIEATGMIFRGHFRAHVRPGAPPEVPSLPRTHSAQWGEARPASPGEGGRAGFLAREARAVPAIAGAGPPLIEWCERRLLARIHQLTLGRLRREIEPVTQGQLLRFLLRWQHVAPGTQLRGAAGLAEIVGQLQGLEIAAGAWERETLPARLDGYEAAFLDELAFRGVVSWGRLTVRQRSDDAQRAQQPTRAAPLGLVLRADLPWLLASTDQDRAGAREGLSHAAQAVHEQLAARGACFFDDLVRGCHRLAAEIEDALGELVAAGLVTGDGFASLRSLLSDPERDKRRAGRGFASRAPRRGALAAHHESGRWSLLSTEPAAEEVAREALARQLLRRWGVVFRDLLVREPRVVWRDLLPIYRRMEARGELRGGRFVAGFVGDQFALPEALESLRALRRATNEAAPPEYVVIAATDPLNLVGIITPGPRVAQQGAGGILLRDGIPIASREGGEIIFRAELDEAERGVATRTLDPAEVARVVKRRWAAVTAAAG